MAAPHSRLSSPAAGDSAGRSGKTRTAAPIAPEPSSPQPHPAAAASDAAATPLPPEPPPRTASPNVCVIPRWCSNAATGPPTPHSLSRSGASAASVIASVVYAALRFNPARARQAPVIKCVTGFQLPSAYPAALLFPRTSRSPIRCTLPMPQPPPTAWSGVRANP